MARTRDIGESKLVVFQANMTLVAAMEAKAAEEDRSVSSLIRRAVSAYLSESADDFHNRGISVAGPR